MLINLQSKNSNITITAYTITSIGVVCKFSGKRKYTTAGNPTANIAISNNNLKYSPIPFGINKNVFGKFPQLGYSNDYGVLNTTDGFMYDDAASLRFSDDNKLTLIVQIIDRYFGNLSGLFAFNGDVATVYFSKTAEDFLNEYQGMFVAKMKK